ncbi:MAG: SLBB domain-containing protein [Cyanobacteriota bacterium]|nr:SLBB domain-containing protein [Cyanobacteriota bacterium]
MAFVALLAFSGPKATLAQLTILEDTELLPSDTNDSLAVEQPYILGPGDRLNVDVLDAPDYSGEILVLADGSLTLPLAGRVVVGGLTMPQATEIISAAYGRIFQRPLVTVDLVAPRPVEVTVLGEVTKPGAYTFQILKPGESLLGLTYPSLTNAISIAEGISLAANLRAIQLRRLQPGGIEKVFTLNIWEFLESGKTGQNPSLRDGDTIFVPSATNIDLEEVRQLATSSLATEPDKPRNTIVLGEVKNPGTYVLIGGPTRSELRPGGLPTLTSAIREAGGIMPEADIRRIELRRNTKAGQEQIINVDLWELLELGNLNLDPIVQDGDVIVIPKATETNIVELNELTGSSFVTDTIQVTIVGEINRRQGGGGGGILNLPPNTTLNQAITAAGGFNNRARETSVELIRVNSNGTFFKRTINLDFSQGFNEETNPLISNNDIIVIETSKLVRYQERWGRILAPVPRYFTIIRILQELNILQ